MVALVTHLNGVAFALFHVEHSEGTLWTYRWRIASECPPGYGEWREETTTLSKVMLQPEIHGCMVEVMWSGADGVFRQAALHTVSAGSCLFRVRAIQDFRFPDEPLRAIAAVSDFFVAEYWLPPVNLAAGEFTDVQGSAAGAYPDNVLTVPGEFVALDPRLRIENLDASTGSLLPCVGGVPVLTRPLDAAPRRVWARVARNSNQST